MDGPRVRRGSHHRSLKTPPGLKQGHTATWTDAEPCSTGQPTTHRSPSPLAASSSRGSGAEGIGVTSDSSTQQPARQAGRQAARPTRQATTTREVSTSTAAGDPFSSSAKVDPPGYHHKVMAAAITPQDTVGKALLTKLTKADQLERERVQGDECRHALCKTRHRGDDECRQAGMQGTYTRALQGTGVYTAQYVQGVYAVRAA